MIKMIHHLPLEAYTSQEWFHREQETIFSKTWKFAGFVEDIKEAGDFISVQAGLSIPRSCRMSSTCRKLSGKRT